MSTRGLLGVLMIEDEAADAELIERELRHAGFDPIVRRVARREECERALAAGAPDLVLCDYGLPGWTGLEAVQLLAAEVPEVPVIVVTGSVAEETAVACMKAGAFDYVLKQNLVRLGSAVAAALELARERRESRRALAQVALLSAAIEQTDESVMLTDRNGTIEYVNQAFERVSGWSRAEAIGNNPRIFKSGEQTPELYKELWGTIGRGETWRGRLINRRRDGSSWEQLVSIAPVRDDRGETAHFVSVARDLTRELELERQLVRSARLEAIGRLAGGVAHDINNVLGVVGGYAELIQMTLPEGHPARTDLTEIFEAVRRGASLTRQLLVFGRRTQTQAESLDLNLAIRNLLRFLRHLLGEDLQIVLELGEGLPPVWADSGRVDQVVANLALNARDAMPRGGTLRISTKAMVLREPPAGMVGTFEPGEWIELAVEDTGTGIEPAIVDQLFEPFFTTKSAAKGAGLGLPTVYGAVGESRGFLGVTSEVGVGSRFAVFLPPFHAQAGPESQHDEELAAKPPTPTRAELTVLLVEDDENLRAVIRAALAGLGFRVLVAASSEEAVPLANTASIDLLVTDVVLPGQNGLDLADRLATDDPNLRVLVMSGYPATALARFGPRAGSIEVLAKPFALGDLQERVARVLDGQPWAVLHPRP